MEISGGVKKKGRAGRLNRRQAGILIAAGALFLALLALVLTLGARTPYRPLEEAEIEALAARNAEMELTEEQRQLTEAALSLAGKVRYFWGGKSSAVGFDPSWGEVREVVSPGSETTGTMRPWGLDCSGYVSWCFRQLGYSRQQLEHLIGNGTTNQWDASREIVWQELRVGDLAFENACPTTQGNHVGLCVGFTEKGEPLFAHCAYSFDTVVVTTAGSVFHYARRPAAWEQ